MTRSLRPRPALEKPGSKAAEALLFRPVPEAARAVLETFPVVLDAIMPLSGAHRRDLPEAVRALSALLTFARGALDRPYWSEPRLASAYLRYFLPWNLIRLMRLLPGLKLPPPGPQALLLDLGSGPLTVPLALWLSFPDWRNVPLHVAAVDSSGRALHLGREIFRRLAPDSPWSLHLFREPLHKARRALSGRPWLITLGNVLNELAERGGGDDDEPFLAGRLADLGGFLAGLLEEGGAICAVEPGTRLGGLALEQFRAGGIAAGLHPGSPCTHAGPCPLLERPGRGWCHTMLDTSPAPAWLRALTRTAGLAKTSLSLSHLVLHASRPPERDPALARILSDAFAVPGLGLARYACTGQGLVLIAAAGDMPRDALVRVRQVRPLRTDPRSGARLVRVSQA